MKQLLRYYRLLMCSILMVLLSSLFSFAQTASDKPVVAIFTQNQTGNVNYDRFEELLKNQLFTSLSKEFKIVDRTDVLKVHNEKKREERIEKNRQASDEKNFVEMILNVFSEKPQKREDKYRGD